MSITFIAHRELSSLYYTGLPTHHTPVVVVNGRRRQVAYARSCCIRPVTIGLTTVRAGTTKRIQVRTWILQSSNFREKKTNFTSLYLIVF